MPQTAFETLRRTLGELPQRVGALMGDMGSPHGDSPAARDIQQGQQAGVPANEVGSLAKLGIAGAADHVLSLTRELAEPVMTFSPWTTARGALEAASTAMWLLEDVDFTTRMARGLSLKLQHLKDEGVFARDARGRHPHSEGTHEPRGDTH